MYLIFLVLALVVAAIVVAIYLQARGRTDPGDPNAQDDVTSARRLPEREPDRWTTSADGTPEPRRPGDTDPRS